ncbi:hypothetical protein Tco_1253578 [Tanacetum coccineum]
MVEKSFLEIQGTFLVKIRDNAFNGVIGESAFEHIEKFVQKFYQLSDNNEEIEADEDDDPNDIDVIFKIEGNLFNFETPLCKAFNEFNNPLKIDTDLFAFDIVEIKTYEEYELNNNMTEDLEEPWSDNGSDIDGFCNGGELPGMVRVRCMTYFQDHKWYDELADGKMNEEALIHKVKFEESWGDATPGVMKFCAWLKNSFENFHELDYDVLVKLEESKEIRRISAWTSQENAYVQFPKRRILLNTYTQRIVTAYSAWTSSKKYAYVQFPKRRILLNTYTDSTCLGLRMMSRLSLKNDMPPRDKQSLH